MFSEMDPKKILAAFLKVWITYYKIKVLDGWKGDEIGVEYPVG